MSLIRKYLISNGYCKNIYAYSYLFNESKMNCDRYYTCLYSGNFNRQFLKCKTVEQPTRKSSVLQFFKEKNYTMSLRARELGESLKMLIPSRRYRYEMYGAQWYQTLDQVRAEDFFELLEMEDSFYSRFKVIELHVWMLLYHLPKDGSHHELIRSGLIKSMWWDSERRVALMSNLISLKTNFKVLYGKFLLSELLYDDGFIKSDTSLASAVWCCFFNKVDVDPRYLEAMVSYIRYQMNHLNKFNMDELSEKEEKGKIWAPVRAHLENVLKM